MLTMRSKGFSMAEWPSGLDLRFFLQSCKGRARWTLALLIVRLGQTMQGESPDGCRSEAQDKACSLLGLLFFFSIWLCVLASTQIDPIESVRSSA